MSAGQLFGPQFLGSISVKEYMAKIAIRRYLMCNRICLRNEGHKRMLARVGVAPGKGP